MDRRQLFRQAAADMLALDLAGRPRARRAGVAEAVRPEDHAGQVAPETAQALRVLARAVVDAVLATPRQGLDAAEAARIIEAAAREHLPTQAGPAQAWRAKLAGRIPTLLDLPRLAELAASGLCLPPLAVVRQTAADVAMVGGRSPEFAELLAKVERLAGIDLPVALEGETGTGKELIARRLHQLSPRRQGPFLAVNCAAVPEALVESELFGHEKGAFTGADKPRLGHMRAAKGGTLFLDEINEASPVFQRKLLRALDQMAVLPLGASRTEALDFRLITASSENLAQAVEDGRFSRPLFYRLQVLWLELPPLRRRLEDLPALIEHFRGQACLAAKCTRRLGPEALAALLAHDWPGNVRQLRNVVMRAVALAPRFEIGLDDLPPDLRPARAPRQAAGLQRRLSQLGGSLAAKAPVLATLLHARRGDFLFNKDLREALDVSDSTAKGLLRELAEAGLVQASGQRGGRRYLVDFSEDKEE
ncbi:putative sigma54 specific transcriptional regulator [Desulfarculus baarsii DSM 2075]|uniref:Sigma54 specific transcriptional regulator n=1 Tax=Desulfarculus baarsii (strain ATCC 33931 / DSM 2075 / LMG 7858 / VKM B-1802 / 2st14) TaxID=644282 RepID=E1QFX0_DESB2|nr:sigma 54-interacting transcriptional regulator [Desulfarculus baarsii]ADK84580.1 putative sigma54 specific transcriptional regulator [Desulfarculus baarsii DSM 2075]